MNKLFSITSTFILLSATALPLAYAAPHNNHNPGLKNKSAAGNIETQKFSRKFASTKKTTKADPYTGTQDKKNFIGKVPMVKSQSAIEKDHTNKK